VVVWVLKVGVDGHDATPKQFSSTWPMGQNVAISFENLHFTAVIEDIWVPRTHLAS